MRGLDMNGEAAGVLFFLFLSVFGFFFFSRLLLNCPFAISSSLGGCTQFSSFKPRRLRSKPIEVGTNIRLRGT